MTEGDSTISKPAKSLLALNPSEDVEFQKKVQQVKKRRKTPVKLAPGVIYVGHIPRGLFEPQIRSYFQQFGKILRMRLSRSKKTGGSKGYAYIEFDCDEVAKIVAETMNNYLMGERLIQCHVVPPEKVHEKLFVGCKRVFKKPTQPAVGRYNKKHSIEELEKTKAKLLSKEAKLRKRLAAHGIDYDFPGFASQVPTKKATASEDANISVLSDDVTPVCTPSILERRKSMAGSEEVDDEIVIKPMPDASFEEDEEDSEEGLSGEEEEGDVSIEEKKEEEA
ncbi:MKI67 FHA domain-interacting nucleolar phosphoprotein [Alosa sapidissima]|uniref:MKI67 FHA domain-interacting nucleolar phosphoprotein n=1 Tax=Alosa sapidissima TaxID=34773 RepID=UPI001C09C454|nr:MKI67 FHA domain-interacting nucleolar phosphoprotein [Alosa sapidissima]